MKNASVKFILIFGLFFSFFSVKDVSASYLVEGNTFDYAISWHFGIDPVNSPYLFGTMYFNNGNVNVQNFGEVIFNNPISATTTFLYQNGGGFRISQGTGALVGHKLCDNSEMTLNCNFYLVSDSYINAPFRSSYYPDTHSLLVSTDIPICEYGTNDCFSGSLSNVASSTRIVSITSPLDVSNVDISTSSPTFSGSFYVASSDLASSTTGLKLRLDIQNASGDNSTTTVNNNAWIDFPVTALDTVLTFSTTTESGFESYSGDFHWINNARYTYSFTLHRGDLGINNWARLLLPNGLTWYQFTTGSFDPTYGKNFDLSACNVISGFDMGDCLSNLLLPNDRAMAAKIDEARDFYARAVPIGYVSRFMEILASTSTVALPSLTLPLFGRELDLTPWGKLMGSESMLASASSHVSLNGTTYGNGKSLRTITETYWNMLWYILLGLAMVHDLIKVGRHSHKKIS